MKNPFSIISYAILSLRMWVRYRLPWDTKGVLRDEAKRLTDERDCCMDGLRAYHSTFEEINKAREQVLIERNAAVEEARGERLGRQHLETQRIEEHEALRRLMFGLSTGLGTTLHLVDEFITQLPDYTPDQADRTDVMRSLVRSAGEDNS